MDFREIRFVSEAGSENGRASEFGELESEKYHVFLFLSLSSSFSVCAVVDDVVSFGYYAHPVQMSPRCDLSH